MISCGFSLLFLLSLKQTVFLSLFVLLKQVISLLFFPALTDIPRQLQQIQAFRIVFAVLSQKHSVPNPLLLIDLE